MARPLKKIDEEQLRKCAEKLWSITEIAAFFKVSTDTLHRRYAAIIEEARQSGKAKLRVRRDQMYENSPRSAA